VLLDPFDPKVIAGAEANGISPKFVEAAQNSPVWKYVMKWKIALPLHPEFRTLPMLYYVPPLLPVSGRAGDGIYEQDSQEFFSSLEHARLPMKYLAALFSAGNVDVVRQVMKRQMAVRYFKRAQELDDVGPEKVRAVLRESGLTEEEAQEIYHLTTLAPLRERYVMPPIQREVNIEGTGCSPEACKGKCGLGTVTEPVRGM
jgi:nitrate reductase / nitrite oxidoreductase, beta subunit